MTKSFTEQVQDMVDGNKAALIGVVRQSIQDVVNEAQEVRGRGGRMPVRFGFLRASGRSSLTGWPTGPNRNDEKATFPSEDRYSDSQYVRLNIAALEIGDTFYFGWTAEYAGAQNIYNGFLDAAIQNWPSYVDKNARAAAKRMKRK